MLTKGGQLQAWGFGHFGVSLGGVLGRPLQRGLGFRVLGFRGLDF